MEDEEDHEGHERTELDDEFDAVLDMYSNAQLGALDEEAEEGTLCGSQQLATFDHLIDEHFDKIVREQGQIREDLDAHLDEGETFIPDLEELDAEPLETLEVRAKPEFDCESILSLRSNLSNHPGKVGRPDRIKPVSEKPAKPLPEITEEDAVELPEVSTFRPRGETADDRKARKDAVKEHKRLCRSLKKETKEAFKTEKKKNAVAPNAGDLREGVRHRPL
jgi:protein LTV1